MSNDLQLAAELCGKIRELTKEMIADFDRAISERDEIIKNYKHLFENTMPRALSKLTYIKGELKDEAQFLVKLAHLDVPLERECREFTELVDQKLGRIRNSKEWKLYVQSGIFLESQFQMVKKHEHLNLLWFLNNGLENLKHSLVQFEKSLEGLAPRFASS